MENGRPLLFKTVEELQEKIEAYFDSCFELQWFDIIDRDENGKKIIDPKNEFGKYKYRHKQKKIQIEPVTITGLAVALKTSRQTLINYEEKEGFFDTIKEAKQFIESRLENGMIKGDINAVAGIFNAKNNFGWVDKKEYDHTSQGKQVGGFNYVKPEEDESDNNTDNNTDDKTGSSVE